MGVEVWKSLWTFVFFGASLAFYVIVLVVGIKGMGSVKSMLANMLAARRGR